jgi:hypothetical protein
MPAHVLGCPAQDSIEKTPLAVTADHQEISLETRGSLNDVYTRVANSQHGHNPNAFLFERGDVLIHLAPHELIGTMHHVLPMPNGYIRRQPKGVEVVVCIDTQEMQGMRRTPGHSHRHLSDGKGMGTILFLML